MKRGRERVEIEGRHESVEGEHSGGEIGENKTSGN